MQSLVPIALLLLAVGPARGADQQSSVSSDLELMVSAALNGQVTASKCSGERQAPLVRMAEQMSPMRAAIKLDAGDLLGTSAVGRLAVEYDVKRMVDAIRRLGLSGAALGHRDMAAPREHLIQFLRAATSVGLPFTLTNLFCDDEGSQFCELIIHGDDPPLLLDTVYGKVAFVAALSPVAFEHAARDRTVGLALDPPAAALSDATRRARAAGARWVVAVYDPAVGRELEDTLSEALKLDPNASPDIMFVPGISDRVSSAITAVASTLLVAVRQDNAMRVRLFGHESDVAPGVRGKAPPEIKAYADLLNRELCERFARPLDGGLLEQPMNRDEFSDLVLGVMREAARADVAVINAFSVSFHAPYPFLGALTPLALMQALPFDNELRVSYVSGAALQAFFNGPNARLFSMRGIESTANGMKINGRPLDPLAEYKVVTSDFVADGGHGGITANGKPATFEAIDHRTIRDALLIWLSRPRTGDISTQPIDPAERIRWTQFYKLQLDFTSVTVINPQKEIFTDAQLARGQSVSVVGEAEYRSFGDHPAGTFESQVRLRYGVARTIDLAGVDSGLVNNVDLSFARSTGVYRRLFSREARWYEPRVYADLYTETEITRPVTRPYHHLQFLPTTGIRFELVPTLALYAGLGATWEVLAHRQELVPQSAPAAFVIIAGWSMRPTKLVNLGLKPIEAESNLDLFVRDLGGQTQMQARMRVRLVVPIFSIVALTTTYDMFLRYVRLQQADGGFTPLVGYSGDIYVGLQVTLAQARQAFAL